MTFSVEQYELTCECPFMVEISINDFRLTKESKMKHYWLIGISTGALGLL